MRISTTLAIAWSGRVVIAVCGLAYIRLTTLVLGEAAFPFFAIILSLIAWLALSDLGMGQVLQNRTARDFAKGRRSSYLGATVVMSIALLLLVHAPLIGLFLDGFVSWSTRSLVNASQDGAPAAVVGSGMLVIGLLGAAVPSAQLVYRHWMGVGEQWKVYLVQSTCSLLTLGLSWYFTAETDGAGALITLMMCLVLPQLVLPGALLLLTICRLRTPLRVRPRLIRWIARNSLNYGIFAIMSALVLQIDIFMLAQYGTAEAVNQYSLASRVTGQALIIISVMTTAITPTFTMMHTTGDFAAVRRTLSRSVAIGSMLLVLFVGTVMVFSDAICAILAPSLDITLPASLLISLGVILWIRLWTDMHGILLYGTMSIGWLLVLVPVQAGIALISMPFLIREFAATGASLAILLSFVLTTAWAVPVLVRKRLAHQNTRDPRQILAKIDP